MLKDRVNLKTRRKLIILNTRISCSVCETCYNRRKKSVHRKKGFRYRRLRVRDVLDQSTE